MDLSNREYRNLVPYPAEREDDVQGTRYISEQYFHLFFLDESQVGKFVSSASAYEGIRKSDHTFEAPNPIRKINLQKHHELGGNISPGKYEISKNEIQITWQLIDNIITFSGLIFANGDTLWGTLYKNGVEVIPAHFYHDTEKPIIEASSEELLDINRWGSITEITSEILPTVSPVLEKPYTQEIYSRSEVTGDKTSTRTIWLLGSIGTILLVLLGVANTGKKIVRAERNFSNQEQHQTSPKLRPEYLAAERKVAKVFVGDPPRLDENKFNTLKNLDSKFQKIYLNHYQLMMLPEDSLDFAPLLAFSPEGVQEIRTLEQLEIYTKKHFPRSHE